MQNEKYVVFKTKDVTWRGNGDDEFASITRRQAVDDAEVIRRQDAFARPALETYANSVGTVAQEMMIAVAGKPDTDPDIKELRQKAHQLQDIADHFAEAAELAAHGIAKLPD